MKEDCGCDDVGALTFADERDDYDELDLVLDDPEVGAVLVTGFVVYMTWLFV